MRTFLRHRKVIAGSIIATLVTGIFAGVAVATNLVDPGSPVQGPSPIAYSSTLGWTPTIPSAVTTPAEIAASMMQQSGFAGRMTVGVSESPTNLGAQSGDWLDFNVPTSGTVAANIRAAWNADLVQGVVAEAFVQRGLPPIVGSKISGEMPDGKSVDLGGGMGDIQPGQSYSDAGDAAITQWISGLLPQWNLSLDTIDIVRAGQPAPAVVVTSPDPAATVAAATSIVNTLFGQNDPLYEGFFFQVDDPSGEPVLVAAAAYRTGAGHYWVAPSLQASSSANHG